MFIVVSSSLRRRRYRIARMSSANVLLSGISLRCCRTIWRFFSRDLPLCLDAFAVILQVYMQRELGEKVVEMRDSDTNIKMTPRFDGRRRRIVPSFLVTTAKQPMPHSLSRQEPPHTHLSPHLWTQRRSSRRVNCGVRTRQSPSPRHSS